MRSTSEIALGGASINRVISDVVTKTHPSDQTKLRSSVSNVMSAGVSSAMIHIISHTRLHVEMIPTEFRVLNDLQQSIPTKRLGVRCS